MYEVTNNIYNRTQDVIEKVREIAPDKETADKLIVDILYLGYYQARAVKIADDVSAWVLKHSIRAWLNPRKFFTRMFLKSDEVLRSEWTRCCNERYGGEDMDEQSEAENAAH